MSLSAAKSRVLQARTQIETGRLDDVEPTLAAAETFLAAIDPLDAAQAPAVIAQIAEIRAEMAGVLLPDDDVVAALGAGGVAEYHAKVDALDARRRAALTAAALERARPLAAGLEVLLAEGLPTGWDGNTVDRSTAQMWSLVSRARQALDTVEDSDAEVDAVRVRVDAGEAAIGPLVEDWRGRARAQAVHLEWSVLLDGVADWADETDSVADHPLEEPRLPKTREAVQRLRHFVRADPGADAAAVWAVHREAEEVFERAGAKLDAAFNAMLDDADTRPVPLRGPDLDRPRHLATAARYTFGGTRFLAANVARCEALHERWQAEVTAVMAARQSLWDRLAAAASEAWPSIVDKHAPGPFSTEPGAVVLLDRVHNRAGWEYAGDVHPFVLRYDGVVLAGDYEPHVLAALEHAWFELKLDVNDRIPWSVIAVVEGPGTVGERTVRFGREEWPPIPCVRLRIVALHAGPVVA
ncbi:hypothetical protein [Dactylosporangium sp. NPDC051541]|uniref:hypothetical protein n=1 Tax=Dactylosporangium sp. NPDC051541 TaxID=3363977 RepID=UPI0037B08C31